MKISLYEARNYGCTSTGSPILVPQISPISRVFTAHDAAPFMACLDTLLFFDGWLRLVSPHTRNKKLVQQNTSSSKQQSSELFPSSSPASISILQSMSVRLHPYLSYVWAIRNRPKIPNSSALEWRSHRRPRRATRSGTRPWERRDKLSRCDGWGPEKWGLNPRFMGYEIYIL